MNADGGAASQPWPVEPMDFPQFCVLTRPRICAVLRSMSGGGDQYVEDVVQEALMIARHRWEDVALYERPDAWVIKVALRLMRRWQRVESRYCDAGELDEPADDTARLAFDRVERTTDLAAVIAALPPRQRDVVNLHYRLDLSVAQIAEVLDMRPGTVKSHLAHGRSTIATRWAANERGDR
ncbi:RNA polymerase sigma factor [Pseudonocardia sp. CA-142604]|uniref:RNA polymerase sigma factor n=1 Tax=Pseudonocardia sp. CA-142604 TaxID=3240024 RepID=UPI003D8A0CC1